VDLALSRRCARALWAAALMATGCAPERVLTLPEVLRGGDVAGGDRRRPRRHPSAHVLTPDEAVRLEAPERADALVEAVAFRRALSVSSGPLALSTTGDPLPKAAATFRADLEALAWAPTEPSDAVRSVRLPAPADDCPRLSAKTETLGDDDEGGVQAFVRLQGARRLAITPSQWYVVSEAEVRPLAPRVPSVHGVATDPSGTYWLASGNELWTAQGELDTATATRARTLPSAPFVITAPQLGIVYALDGAGNLMRSDSSTTTVVHRFRVNTPDVGTRGTLVDDGLGVLAGLGSDPTFVRIAEDGRLSTYTLPDLNEGVVSLARFAEYGLVVGTSIGLLRAESLAFGTVPDPLGQMPRGVQVRLLHELDGRLYFGGNSGTFGAITERRFVCQAGSAASGVRFLTDLGNQLIVGGLSLDATADQINLTRYTREP
jgi:hypothetical protein